MDPQTQPHQSIQQLQQQQHEQVKESEQSEEILVETSTIPIDNRKSPRSQMKSTYCCVFFSLQSDFRVKSKLNAEIKSGELICE